MSAEPEILDLVDGDGNHLDSGLAAACSEPTDHEPIAYTLGLDPGADADTVITQLAIRYSSLHRRLSRAVGAAETLLHVLRTGGDPF